MKKAIAKIVNRYYNTKWRNKSKPCHQYVIAKGQLLTELGIDPEHLTVGFGWVTHLQSAHSVLIYKGIVLDNLVPHTYPVEDAKKYKFNLQEESPYFLYSSGA